MTLSNGQAKGAYVCMCERERHTCCADVMRDEREGGGSEREQVIAREREQDRKG